MALSQSLAARRRPPQAPQVHPARAASDQRAVAFREMAAQMAQARQATVTDRKRRSVY